MKKLLIIGGSSALVLLSILFGAFFAGPLFASANSTTATASPTTTNTYCVQYQQDLANRLNVSVSTLQQDSKSAREDVLAQLVKDGKLTQSQADSIKQRIENHQACTGNGHVYSRFVTRQFLQKYRSDIATQVAQGLHLSADQLTSQLKAGKSLSQIASAQNVSTSQLQTIVTNAIKGSLSKAISAGDLTQTQANNFTQFLQKHPHAFGRILDHHFDKHNK